MAKTQSLDANGKPYNRGLLLATVIIGTFATVLTQTLLATAYPTLMDAFDISTATVQWLTTGFLLVNGIMIPISAWLINRFNSKYLYISAMVIFFIGTWICWQAPNFAILLTGRLVEAVGGRLINAINADHRPFDLPTTTTWGSDGSSWFSNRTSTSDWTNTFWLGH